MSTFFILFALLLLISTFHLHGAYSESNNMINSSCTTTLYPDLCYDTFSNIPKIATRKDAIEFAINKTKNTIKSNFHTIEKLIANTVNLTKRAKMALDDCLEMGAATLEGLDTVIQNLREYPNKKSLARYADDLKTLMSTTITNKDTCLDGLSFDAALRKAAIKGQDHGGKMCSNVLAMIKNMTDADMAEFGDGGRRRKLEWLSAGDRKLLGFWGVTADVTVAKNGKGNYTTVAEAVAAAPAKSSKRYVIKITAGVYSEYVEIPKNKTNIMFLGEGRSKTVITGNKNVASGTVTTSKSATVAALGERFLARDITFENTAGPSGHQAVALRVQSDLSAFYKCAILGYQDTLYTHSNRQFYIKCLITGTIDFIFGNAAVVFQFCDIQARKPNPNQRNMVTAQGRTDINQPTGIVIHRCQIDATSDLKPVQRNVSTYLGRPWMKFSRTIVMRSVISEVISTDGWYPWDKEFALDTLYYREYRNTGPGADTSKRVTWKGWGVMKDRSEAKTYTVGSFINGWSWLLSTGFPFWPGL